MTDDIRNPKLDWEAIKEAGSRLGIDPTTWPPMDHAAIMSGPDRPDHETEVDVRDEEWAAIQHVLPADCGGDRRVAISVALFIVSTGRPWTTLPARFGSSWNAHRRRFGRWCHAGHWARIAEAIEAAEIPED